MRIIASVIVNGVTKEQYEEMRKTVNWEGNVPKGAVFHAAAFDKSGLKVTDIWESETDFTNFFSTRVTPAMQKYGIKSEPKVEILPLHAIFTPGFTKK